MFSIIAEVLYINRFTKDKISGKVNLPVSKSMANRLLMIQALKQEPLDRTLLGISDIDVLYNNLLSNHETRYFNDAGTPLRLFIAYAALKNLQGIVIDGHARLRERPVKGLINALEAAGAKFEFLDQSYCLPFKLIKGIDITNKAIQVSADVSSQFVSALLLIGPYLEHGLHLSTLGEKRSEPYIDLTIFMMKQFGVDVVKEDTNYIVPKATYNNKLLELEADWSGAAFFYNLVSISNQFELRLERLYANSFQGDKIVADYYKNLGVETIFDCDGILIKSNSTISDFLNLDIKNFPDIFPAITAAIVFHGKSAIIRGVASLKDKESDRVEAMKFNLEQAGGIFKWIDNDTIELSHSLVRNRANFYRFKTFGDHRVAMALAIFTYHRECYFDDAEVVNKSFPKFWDEWVRLTGSSTQEISE